MPQRLGETIRWVDANCKFIKVMIPPVINSVYRKLSLNDKHCRPDKNILALLTDNDIKIRFFQVPIPIVQKYGFGHSCGTSHRMVLDDAHECLGLYIGRGKIKNIYNKITIR